MVLAGRVHIPQIKITLKFRKDVYLVSDITFSVPHWLYNLYITIKYKQYDINYWLVTKPDLPRSESVKMGSASVTVDMASRSR